MARRIGLNPPRAWLPREVSRARVRAIWKQHSEFTAKQVKDSLGHQLPLGEGVVRRLLKSYRLEAAKVNPALRRIRGCGPWSPVRVRIGEIWKSHPEYTGKQVVKALGPCHSANLQWVQRVLIWNDRSSLPPGGALSFLESSRQRPGKRLRRLITLIFAG